MQSYHKHEKYRELQGARLKLILNRYKHHMQNYKHKSGLNKVIAVPELVTGDVMDETLETDSLKRTLELNSDDKLDILE